MHQKDAVRHAWEAAGLYKRDDPKLQRFLQQLDDHPTHCWPDFVAILRSKYAEYKEDLAVPVWSSGDKLLRVNILRSIDRAYRDEVDLALRLLRGTSGDDDYPELLAAALLREPEIDAALRARTDLPDDVKQIVTPPPPPRIAVQDPAPEPDGRRTIR